MKPQKVIRPQFPLTSPLEAERTPRMLDHLHHQIDRILRRRSHYRATFSTPSGEKVLADLKRFCRAASSSVIVSPQSGVIDTHAMAVNEGRREVFLRIASHLHLDDAALMRMREENPDA